MQRPQFNTASATALQRSLLLLQGTKRRLVLSAQLRRVTQQNNKLRATLRDTADFRRILRRSFSEYWHTPSSSLLVFAKNQPVSRPESGVELGSIFTEHDKRRASVKAGKPGFVRSHTPATRYLLPATYSLVLLATCYVLLAAPLAHASTLGGAATSSLGNALFTQTYNIQGTSTNVGNVLNVNVGAGLLAPGTFGGTVGKGSYEFQASSTSADVMYIDANNARVGIGTTSPNASLEVRKDYSGGTSVNFYNATDSTGTYTTLGIHAGGGNDFNIYTLAPSYTTSGSLIADSTTIEASSNASGGLNVSVGAAAPIRFWTNGSEKMRIQSDGNVGIGTTSPGALLDVRGTSFRDTSYTATKDFYLTNFNHGAATTTNEKVDLYMTGTQQFWGYIDVTLTDYYNYQNAAGGLTKRFYLGINPPGPSIYTNESRYIDEGGVTADNWAISDLRWDGTNLRYYITIVHRVSTSNMPMVVMKAYSNTSAHIDNFLTFTVGSSYTTDTTAYGRPYVTFNNNVGIGKSNPATALDVNGTVTANAFSGNLTGLLNASYITGGSTFGLSNATSGTNYRFNDISANPLLFVDATNSRVGIWTASPTQTFQVGDSNTSGKGVRIQNGGGASRTAYMELIGTTAASANQTWYAGMNVWATDGSFEIKPASAIGGIHILPSGNVGIGTTGPGYALHVVGDTRTTGLFYFGSASNPTRNYVTQSSARFTAANDLNTLDISVGNGLTTIGSNYFSGGANIPILLTAVNGGTNQLYLATTGNVGIGTTAPKLRLDVDGLVGAPATSGTTQTGIMRLRQESYYNVLDFGSYVTSPYGLWMQGTGYNDLGVTYPIVLQPNGGNVGIGTTNPTQKLEVNGTSLFSDDMTIVGGKVLKWSSNDVSTPRIYTFSTTYGLGTDASDMVIFSGSGGGTTFKNDSVSGTALMRIRGDGNVGIGTTSPGAKLEVAGAFTLSDSYYNLYYSAGQTISVALGTETWIKLATFGNRGYARIRVGTGSSNSEEEAEIEVISSYYTAQTAINVKRQTYNEHLREVRVTGADGGNKSVYIKIRSADYAPTVTWRVVESKTLVSIDNVAASPTGGTALVVSGALTVSTNSTVTAAAFSGNLTGLLNAQYITAGTFGTNNATSGAYRFNDASANPLFYIDNTNSRVGIGTTAPGQKLHIDGIGGTLAGTAAITLSDGNSGSSRRWSISNGAGGNTVDLIGKLVFSVGSGSYTADPMAGTAVMTLSGTNLGIGTTGPTTFLDVFAPNRVQNNTGMVKIRSSDSMAADLGGSLTFGGYGVAQTSIGDWGSISGRKENGNSANYMGYLAFATADSGNTQTEKMRITSTGNVGIGTTGPSYRLHVSGVSASSNVEKIGLDALGYTGGVLRAGPGAGGFIAGLQVMSGASQGIALSPNGNMGLNVDQNGNVGIGTTSPDGKLHLVPGNMFEYKFKYIGTSGGEYRKSVILLHAAYNAANLGENYTVGKLFASRGDSTSFNRKEVAEISTGAAYTQTNGTLRSVSDGSLKWRLVTVTYNSIKYLAIELPYAAGNVSNGITFEGYHKSTVANSLTLVDYYNVQTSTAINTEVNNSVTAFTSYGNVYEDASVTVSGTVTAGTFVGSSASALSASYTSAGVFGSNSTKGNYEFQQTTTTNSVLFVDANNSRVGIGTTSPAQQLELTASMRLPATTNSTTGVIYKGANRFVHDFTASGADGANTFVGVAAGNFTMGIGGGSALNASYNTALGYTSLSSLTTGNRNTAVGYNTLNAVTTGCCNTALGTYVLQSNQGGGGNTALGFNTQSSHNGGTFNVSVGYNSLTGASVGSRNTVVGSDAGGSIAGNNNVLLGYTAGAYETGSNTLYIDNQDRTNLATQKTNSLIYGVFAASPANQTLTFNANANVTGSLFQPVYGTDDGLVLYLPFNATSTSVTTQYDRSPYGNDASLTSGNPQCGNTLGKYGVGCSLVSATTDFIQVPDSPSLRMGTGNFTIETWVKIPTYSVTVFPFVYKNSGNYGNAGTTGYAFSLVNNQIQLRLAQSGTTQSVTSVANAVTATNTWYHIVAVSNGASSKIYVDGVDVTSSNAIDGTLNTDDSTALSLNYGGHTFYLGNEVMDEVKIYKRALSVDEVRTHYLRGSGFGASGALTADKFRVVDTSGNVKFIVSSGNVGIGTTSPTDYDNFTKALDIAGTNGAALYLRTAGDTATRFAIGASASQYYLYGYANNPMVFYTNHAEAMRIAANGTLSVGGGTGKITAGTFDPVYTIGGAQYATYLSGMTGVKEETTGVISVQKSKCKNQNDNAKCENYEYTIDFDAAEKGSDLWLFSKTTALKKQFANLTVLLTPQFDGRVWYEKDSAANRLTIYATPSATRYSLPAMYEVSYRLTAPRFDAAEWPNKSKDDVEGLVVPEE